MKKDIHPDNYRLVVFKDMSNGDTFITQSCAESKETVKIDGTEYPLIKREISSSSHPFYTGKMKLVDTAGRVDKFYKKFGKSSLSSSAEKVEDSAAGEPAADLSVAEEPTLKEPTLKEPTAEEPTAAEPTAAEPTAEEPTAEEPEAEESVAEEPAAEEPEAEEPTSEESVAEEPAAEEPEAEEPTSEDVKG